MSGLGPLGIGIIVAFIVFILFVMIEIYYFILKKKRRRTRDRRGMMISIEETQQRNCEVVIIHEGLGSKSDASGISNAENVMKWPSIEFMKTKMKKCVNWLILRSIGMAKDCVIMLQWSLLKISYYISGKSIDGNREAINGERDSVCESADVKVPMDMKKTKKKKKQHSVKTMISGGFKANKEEGDEERKNREDCVGEGEECEDEDEDIFKIGGLWGPPRLLFTITEETKEEMELELDEEKKPDDDNEEEEEVTANSRGKNGDGNSRRGSGAASSPSSEFLQLIMAPSSSSCSSPYLTPPSSPPFITPLGSPPFSSSSSSSSVALSKLHLPPSCLIIPSSSSVEFDNVSSSSSSSTNSSSSPLPQSRQSLDESSSSSSLSSSSSASFSSSSSSSSQTFSPPPLMVPKHQQRGPLSLLFHEPLSSAASLSPSSSLYHAHIRRVHPISPPLNPDDGNPISSSSSSSSSFKKSPSAELSSVVSPSSACADCPPRFVIPAFSKPTTPSPFRHVFQQKICNGHRVSFQVQ